MLTHATQTGHTLVQLTNGLTAISKTILLFSFIIPFNLLTAQSLFHPLSQWEGDTSHFTQHEGRLQLDAPGSASPSSIAFPTDISHDITWRLSFSMHFAPSASNRIAFDLMSSDTPYEHAYRLRIGETGDRDTYELAYITPDEEEILWRGPEGLYARQQDTIQLKIQFTDSGEWLIYYKENREWQHHGTIHHAKLLQNRYFKIHCHYTSTRSDLYDFHQATVNGTPFQDTIPPEMQWKTVHDTLYLEFSEPITTDDATLLFNDRETAATPGHQSLRIPLKEYRNTAVSVTSGGIADTAGNVMPDTTFTFFHQSLSRYDILISEVMTAPTPERFLPPYEYIELTNTADFSVTLEEWHLVIKEDTIVLPDISLNPKEATLLSSSPEAYHDSIHTTTVHLPTLSRYGVAIQLLNHHQHYIHDFHYTPKATQDEKHTGGWSQELADPDQPCLGRDNIHYSTNHLGGTPGFHTTDTTLSPEKPFLTLQPENDTLYSLKCAHALDVPTLTITPEETHINAIREHHREVTFTPSGHSSDGPQPISVEVRTCSGHLLDTVFHVQRMEVPSFGDLSISELLFDGSDRSSFIEVCNQSTSSFDASGINIGFTQDQHTLPSIHKGYEKKYLWTPGRCLVFSDTPEELFWHYDVKYPFQVLDADMPNLVNKGGHIFLYNSQGELLDSVHYSSDYHSPFIDNTKGVSLTRSAASGDNPWQSTPTSHLYGTPTWHPYLPETDKNRKNQIAIPYTTISPQGGQYHHQLVIRHDMSTTDHLMNATLYSLNGSKVATIASNNLLNRKGIITWDGIGDNGKIPAAGVYALVIKIIDQKGNSTTTKELIVIAGEL